MVDHFPLLAVAVLDTGQPLLVLLGWDSHVSVRFCLWFPTFSSLCVYTIPFSPYQPQYTLSRLKVHARFRHTLSLPSPGNQRDAVCNYVDLLLASTSCKNHRVL